MRLRSILLLALLVEIGTLVLLGVLTRALVPLGVVVGTMMAGSAMLRRPGLRISGALFMVPGLVTDALAVLFLLPAPRRWAGRVMQALFLRGMPQGGFRRVVFTPQDGMPPPWGPPPQGGAPRTPTDGVVEAEVLDVRPSRAGDLPAE